MRGLRWLCSRGLPLGGLVVIAAGLARRGGGPAGAASAAGRAFVTAACGDAPPDAVAALVESLRPCGLLVVVIADRADAANVSRACPDCSVAAGDGVDERRGCVDAFARAWALPFSEVAYFAPNALAVKVTGPDGACGLLGDAALARLPVNAVLAAGGPLDGDAPDPSVVVLRPHVRTAAAIKEWADATPHASPAELLAAFFSPGDQSPNSQSPKPGKWFRLPRTSNVQTSMARLPGYPALADRAAVLVFDGPARPWDFFRTASPRWRDSFDPAAWWAWQRAANAARARAGLLGDGQAARWAGRQASCNALFGQTGGADPGNGAAATMGLLPWPVSRTLLPPPPGSRGGKLAVLLATFDRALDTVALLLRHYAASPAVSAVYLLWLNPSTAGRIAALPPGWPHRTPTPPPGMAPITVVPAPRDSLNARFHPLPSLPSSSILVADDDMLPSHAALDLLRRVHLLDPDRPASFHARGHARGHDGYPKYLAGAHEMRGYSLALTKLMAAPADLLFAYSCMLPDAVHALVDREANCEDVAAGFLASGTSGKPPLLAWPRDVAVRCAPLAPGEDPGTPEGKKAYFDAGYLDGGYFFRGADGPATRLGCRAEAAVHDFGSRGGGLSSKPGHFAARARCLAELEGVFGDALVTARETVGEFRGLPPVGGGGMEDLAEARELVRGPG